MSDKESSQPDSSELGSSDTAAVKTGSTMALTVIEPMPPRSSQRYGLDMHSCLQLLIDVYGSILLQSQSGQSVPITLFNETIRSVSLMINVFSLSLLFNEFL